MPTRPTPETDELFESLGSDADYSCCYTLRDHARRLEHERDELREWKKEQLAVESEWNPQEVARLLDIPLGGSIRAAILPKISNLREKLEELQKQLDVANKELDTIAGATNMQLVAPEDFLEQMLVWSEQRLARIAKENQQ